MKTEMRQPPREGTLIEAAAANPGGWVYDIDWVYRPDRRVPPEAIRGSWQVDAAGKLTGEYAVNDRYRPVHRVERDLPPYMIAAARSRSDEWMVEIDSRAEHMFPNIPEKMKVGYWYIDKNGELTNLFRANSLYQGQVHQR